MPYNEEDEYVCPATNEVVYDLDEHIRIDMCSECIAEERRTYGDELYQRYKDEG